MRLQRLRSVSRRASACRHGHIRRLFDKWIADLQKKIDTRRARCFKISSLESGTRKSRDELPHNFPRLWWKANSRGASYRDQQRFWNGNVIKKCKLEREAGFWNENWHLEPLIFGKFKNSAARMKPPSQMTWIRRDNPTVSFLSIRTSIASSSEALMTGLPAMNLFRFFAQRWIFHLVCSFQRFSDLGQRKQHASAILYSYCTNLAVKWYWWGLIWSIAAIIS